MGRKACTGAGLTARRGGRAALAVGGLAVMALLRADGVSAVIVDGHVSGFGPAGRALHGAAALSGHQQRDEVLAVGQLEGLDHFFGVAGLIILQQRTLQGLALGVFSTNTGLRV